MSDKDVKALLYWEHLVHGFGKDSMPTVLRVGPYRFFFYSSDGRERPHVHVEAGEHSAKYWLSPPRRARTGGFAERELREIETLIAAHHDDLVEAWHGYFGTA